MPGNNFNKITQKFTDIFGVKLCSMGDGVIRGPIWQIQREGYEMPVTT